MTPERIAGFRQTASDPSAWQQQARELRESAQLIWDSYAQLFDGPRPGSREEALAVVDRWFERMRVAQLLYGLAVECALKARIIANDPRSIEFRPKHNDANELVDLVIHKIGINLGGDGHDLVKLAAAAEVFDDGALFKVESDRVATREILAYLTDCVRWSSRYPAPKRASEGYVPEDLTPPRILGHYMRDFLDPFLDVLLTEG